MPAPWEEEHSSTGRLHGGFLDQGNLTAAERATMLREPGQGQEKCQAQNTPPMPSKRLLGSASISWQEGHCSSTGSTREKWFPLAEDPVLSQLCTCPDTAPVGTGPALTAAQSHSGHSCGSAPRELR